jgi:tetratricopeptide (TPR) repeat protein
MYRSALFILSAALASACGGQKPLTALEIDRRAETLTWQGRWDEAKQLVDGGLDDARRRGDSAAEARLLLRRGHTVTNQTRHRGGDGAPALADLEAARRAAEASGDRELLADAIDALGMHRFVAWFATQRADDLAAADQQFREALAIRVSLGESPPLADSHFHVGLAHQFRNEDDAARREFERALAVAERTGDAPRMAHPTRHLGYMAERRREWAEAEELYRRSLELFERSGPGPGVAAAQVTLAELRYARGGSADDALGLLARARDGAARTGSVAYVAIASQASARIHRDRGRYDEALHDLATAIRAMESRRDEDVPEACEQMALVELLRGDPAAALADVERGLARRSSPRLVALGSLARARTGQPVTPAAIDSTDAVVVARLALAKGDTTAALDAALRGDDPDTLLLAARAAGPTGFDRAIAAATAMSPAQQQRFERESRTASAR